MKKRPVFIVGANSRLGSELYKIFSSDNCFTIGREEYSTWIEEDGCYYVKKYFKEKEVKNPLVMVCVGAADPSLSQRVLKALNFQLPLNIINSIGRDEGKVITFGTIMENFIPQANNYIASKKLLGDFISKKAGNELNALHIRIHTLFGTGQPSKFMFLGKILTSLVENRHFSMTSGQQIREYHHTIDDAAAVKLLDSLNINGSVDLNHGEPVRLVEIAKYIFNHFDRSNKLKIGALSEPSNENYNFKLQRPECIAGLQFRDTLPSILQYMRCCLKKNNTKKSL